MLSDENLNPRIKKFSDILKNVDVNSFQPAEVKNPKEDVALIVCSSGASGFPKALAYTHYTLCYAHKSFRFAFIE